MVGSLILIRRCSYESSMVCQGISCRQTEPQRGWVDDTWSCEACRARAPGWH